ncbi:MAG: site-specific integrase [Lachnospiraceae bacterium]|nr:site-specific integrase [Lachnospiraceae bacterium]
MAKAKKTKSGNWRCLVYDYTNGDGKRIYKSFTAPTKKEAEYLATQFKFINKKNSVDSVFEDAVNSYIEAKKNTLSPTTIKGYQCIQRNNFSEIAHLRLSQFNSANVSSWIGSLSHLSPKTVKNIYGLFVAVLDFNGTNHDYKVKLPQKRQIELYVPTDEEVKTVINHFSDNNDKDMVIAIYLAAYGTLRRSEICALSASDVKGNCVRINKAAVYDGPDIVIKEPKTASSNRVIELPEFVINELPKRGKLVNITPHTLTNRFERCFNELEIKKFRFHDLRHYSASIMHAIGVPDVYIMERGGWKSDATLKNIYRNSLDDFQRKYIEQTNNYFSKMQL